MSVKRPALYPWFLLRRAFGLPLLFSRRGNAGSFGWFPTLPSELTSCLVPCPGVQGFAPCMGVAARAWCFSVSPRSAMEASSGWHLPRTQGDQETA